MRIVALICSLFLIAALAERQARQERAAAATAATVDQQARLSEIAALLRSGYHPKQSTFARSKKTRRIACTTRRAGKTTVVAAETMARCLDAPNQRWAYCHATRAEAKRLIWRGDPSVAGGPGDGWLDLIERRGLKTARTRKEFDADPKTEVLVNETELTIDFRNGSQLMVFCADTQADGDKFRGGQKSGVVVDEAQKYPGLTYFVSQVVEPMLAHPTTPGELWLCGTPSQTLDGLFYEASKPDDHGARPLDEDGEPTWELHHWTVSDNPGYGATPEQRWAATAGATLRSRGWKIENPPPEFVREWLGQWTKGDALYVYAVHAMPPDEFAPSRVDLVTGAYDHAVAMADLPVFVFGERGERIRIRWMMALGLDFGFDPDPFAWVLWAFSPDIADIYEMGSWKQTLLTPPKQKRHILAIWKQVSAQLVVCVGDAGGAQAKGTIVGWRESTGLPIEEADKHDKRVWIEHYNGELYAENIHYREGSLLLEEQRALQWRVKKAKDGDATGEREEWAKRRTADGKVPGNHCSDAGLYSVRHLVARRTEFAAAPRTEAERLAVEERRLLAAATKDARRDVEAYAEKD